VSAKGHVFTDAELRRLAATGMRKLIERLAEDLDWIVQDLGDDAATVTVGALLIEGHKELT
jgi:hypothetical protein